MEGICWLDQKRKNLLAWTSCIYFKGLFFWQSKIYGVAEAASKLGVVRKANEKKEKEMERLKKENKRLKQKVSILFDKFNMAPLGDSDSDDGEDE